MAKGHAFPAGVAQSALRTARCRSYSLRAQHNVRGKCRPGPFTPAWHGSTWARWLLAKRLPEKDWRHARARHSLWHSVLPPKENSARSPLCKNTCKTASFPVQYTKRFRDLPTQSQSARNHRGFPGKEGRNTNGTQVFPKRHRNHEAGRILKPCSCGA